jgi:hypothetical protein
VGRRYFRPCRCGGGLCGVDLPEVGALDCRYEGENLDQALSLSGEVSPQLLRTFSSSGDSITDTGASHGSAAAPCVAFPAERCVLES